MLEYVKCPRCGKQVLGAHTCRPPQFNHTDLSGERCKCKGHPFHCYNHPESCGCNMSPEKRHAENVIEKQQNANMSVREAAIARVLI